MTCVGGVEKLWYYTVPKNTPTPPQKGLEFPGGGVGGSVRPKKFKNAWSLIGISRGVGSLRKDPFHGELWIFSGITNYESLWTCCNFYNSHDVLVAG